MFSLDGSDCSKTSFAKEPSCPVCSYYDYQEKLLERVIRNELTLKDTLEKITETNAKVEETLKRIEKENSKLKTMTELGAMKDKSIVPLVMFHARLSTNDHHSYTAQQNIIFKTVIANEGGCYDSTTGHFTASVAGVFMFIVQYCPYTNKWAHVEIVQNARPLQRSAHKGEDYHLCVSIQTFANVATGDKVWVRATDSDMQNEDYRWNTFSGLLIRS